MTTPAQALGITGGWKLQYGLPGVSGIKELSPSQLVASAGISPYWVVSSSGRCRFRTMVNAGTTDNSTYPRVELREMNGTSAAKWDSAKESRWYEITFVGLHLPPGKPQTCIAQFHDAKNDLIEVIWQRNGKGSYELTWRVGGSSSGQPVVPLDLGRVAVIALGCVKGQASVYLDGKRIFSAKMPTSSATYAKVGNYLQSNLKYDAAGEYGEVEIGAVRSGTGTYPGPASAPPSQPPAEQPQPPATTRPKRVVIVMRHAEKDDNADGKEDVLHELSERGKQRAQAFKEQWLKGVPAGIPGKPDRCIASKGTTASNRPLKTIEPYQLAAGLPMNTRYDAEKDYAALGPWLAQRLDVTLVCLEHSAIVNTCKGLGTISPGLPKAWDSARFDLYWVFTSDDGKNWKFTQVPQLLLPGDKNTPIK